MKDKIKEIKDRTKTLLHSGVFFLDYEISYEDIAGIRVELLFGNIKTIVATDDLLAESLDLIFEIETNNGTIRKISDRFVFFDIMEAQEALEAIRKNITKEIEKKLLENIRIKVEGFKANGLTEHLVDRSGRVFETDISIISIFHNALEDFRE